MMFIGRIYYQIKPFVPRGLQIAVRRLMVARKRSSKGHIWPIDPKANMRPERWAGWPDQRQFALVLTHDVDTVRGHERVYDLANLEKALGFRSSFNFVPERYEICLDLHYYLRTHCFEIGVHGLIHDGKLFKSRKIFQCRALHINRYLKDWGAVGFRSPAMHHNLDWIGDLDIEYDSSTFDTDPFEPQSDGMGTIFPFLVKRNATSKSYVELPYTLPQDFTLFILMNEKDINIWKKKLDWIVEHGGMALLNTHPDYMNFNGKRPKLGEYPKEYYEDFLEYIKFKYKGQYWHVVPRDLARYWKSNFSCH